MASDLDDLFIKSLNNAKIPGTYILMIELTEAIPITVGRLGIHIFEPGYYLYTGSALNELVSRISRHIRLDKPCHWHIDYITQAGRVTGIFWDVGREKMNAEIKADVRLPISFKIFQINIAINICAT